MIRTRLLWVKHLFCACFFLATLVCLAEVGLRVFDSMTGQITRRDLYDRGLICKSWFTHHSLRPAQAFAVKNPDTEARVKVITNGFGMRGAEPVQPKPPGVYRVICLGDETTFAAQFPESETFCGQLQQLLQQQTRLKVEVLNAGIPNYCPLLSYLQLSHQLLGLQPDLVVLNFDMSDVSDDYQYRRFTSMSPAGAPVACAHPELEVPRSLLKSRKDNPLLLPEFARQKLSEVFREKVLTETTRAIDTPHGRYAWLEDHPPDWSTYIEQALAPLKQAQDLAGGAYIGFVVATYPAPWQVAGEASAEVRERVGVPAGAVFRSRRPFDLLGEYCRTHKLLLCDTSPAFQLGDRGDDLYLRKAAVFSAGGHALYARELSKFLAQNVQGFSTETSPPAGTFPQARLFPR